MKIVICDQDHVDAYAHYVSKILNILGALGALVTDESQVYDFLLPIIDAASQQDDILANHKTLAALSDLAARPVSEVDLIWQLARDMQERVSRVYH